MARGPMILWDKTPEVRKRWREIVSNPDDPLFFIATADYLAGEAAIPRAIRTVGAGNLIQHWREIRKKMESRAATAS